jgi:hypothetical protein
MALIVSVYRILASMIALGFRNQAIGKSEYNAFVAENVISATSLDSSQVASLVPENLILSKGSIASIPCTMQSMTAGQNYVSFLWSPTPIPIGGRPNDLVSFVAYNETQDMFAVGIGVQWRENNDGGVDLPGPVQIGDVIYGWMVVTSQSDNSVSTSVVKSITITA